MLSVIAIFYFNFSKSMNYVSQKLIDQASTNIFQGMMDEFINVQMETEEAAKLIKRKVIDNNNDEQMIEFINHTMARVKLVLPSIQSIYWSDENGMVILAEKLDDGAIGSEVVIHGEPLSTQITITRNLQGKVIKSDTRKTSYDHRKRFWYMDAKASGKTVVTDVYLYTFFERPYWGITLAAPVTLDNGQFVGVVGTNIRLDFLRKMIEKIKITENSIIFIALDNGQLVAYPHLTQFLSPALENISQIKDQSVTTSFDIYKKTHKNEFIFRVNNQNYLAAYKEISGYGPHHWIIGIVVPENDFVGSLDKANYITMGFGILLLLIGIYIFFNLITRTMKSLKQIINETEKIKNFELGETIQIKSRIKEIIYLADALNNMKKGLRSFQKYVPASLVRQLVENKMDTQIGGSKKQLVTFFSDIKDFTTISETLDPNLLMTLTCEYFDELSKIIIHKNGTIDKYIGDSIMAFWGALSPEPNACYLAAKAALECQERLISFNKKLQERSIPPFITRIGIHAGDAIVGNLGSSERINYTAIGDTINTASRLEGCNKIYHTKIIVSASVYEELKNQFIFRLLDCVALKGKEKEICIYELIDEKPAILTYDLEAYKKQFEIAFAEYQNKNWDKAVAHFEQCIQIYPQDKLAPLFIDRCNQLKLNPPDEHWNGVWHFS